MRNKEYREELRTTVFEKIKESALSVIPIVAIVSVLCLFLHRCSGANAVLFLIGGILLTVGMGLFSLGAEQSMTPIGNKIGTSLTKTKNMPLILIISFSWVCNNHCRARPSGACRNGAAHQQCRVARNSGCRCRYVYVGLYVQNNNRCQLAAYADFLLSAGFCSSVFSKKQLFGELLLTPAALRQDR